MHRQFARRLRSESRKKDRAAGMESRRKEVDSERAMLKERSRRRRQGNGRGKGGGRGRGGGGGCLTPYTRRCTGV